MAMNDDEYQYSVDTTIDLSHFNNKDSKGDDDFHDWLVNAPFDITTTAHSADSFTITSLTENDLIPTKVKHALPIDILQKLYPNAYKEELNDDIPF